MSEGKSVVYFEQHLGAAHSTRFWWKIDEKFALLPDTCQHERAVLAPWKTGANMFSGSKSYKKLVKT